MPCLSSILLPNSDETTATPIFALTTHMLENQCLSLSQKQRLWLEANDFTAKLGEKTLIPQDDGSLYAVFLGLGEDETDLDPFYIAKQASLLPEGTYCLVNLTLNAELVALGWLLESYRFNKYKISSAPVAKLCCPKNVNRGKLLNQAKAIWLTRDLINTPANDMGPDALEEAVKTLANKHKARFHVWKGEGFEQDFPLIHAVGRANPQVPRLLELRWGDKTAPKVTLIGKGICFDTGGLGIKPSSNMLLMKKDMGGAANVLGLADILMREEAKINLRVLIPTAENSISGNAFRPSDVITSRKGTTVEIGHTDAEGRLVMADALSLADEEEPEILLDMATLTGAARVALGTDLPAFFCNDDMMANDIISLGQDQHDPLWRMPLWQGYKPLLKSETADLNNVSGGGFAGAITAALFLESFVEKAKSFSHIDLFAWTNKPKPGHPFGGEAQGIRTLAQYIINRFKA